MKRKAKSKKAKAKPKKLAPKRKAAVKKKGPKKVLWPVSSTEKVRLTPKQIRKRAMGIPL